MTNSINNRDDKEKPYYLNPAKVLLVQKWMEENLVFEKSDRELKNDPTR